MSELPWLTKDFLAECLGKEGGREHTWVTDFSVAAAVAPGNNYGSKIVRVKVKYKEREQLDSEEKIISLIIKSELDESKQKDIFDSIEVVEPTFYNKYLPEVKKICETSFAPKSFFSPIPSLVILEDLKDLGFAMADKTKQLDFDHCRLYAVNAATFHATSFAVHKKNSELVEILGKEKLYNSDNKPMEDGFRKMFKGALTVLLRKLEERAEHVRYRDILMTMREDLWDYLAEAHRRRDEVNTINQGDPWTTNMMFKYDEQGRVCDMKLLDFQALRYGSPINDLIFFFWTSANLTALTNSFDEFLNIYVDNFNERMKECGCAERLTYEDVLKIEQRLSPLAFYIAVVTLPLLYHPGPIDLDLIFGKEPHDPEVIQLYEMYYNEDFLVNRFPILIKQLELRGVFDYLTKNKL